MTGLSAGAALVAATGLHLGFQLVVTVLVYPALARVPADRWVVEHALHSRRITPVVGVVYGLLLVAGASVLVDGPTALQVGSLLAVGTTMLVTAVVAAPLHSRLGAPAADAEPAALPGTALPRTALTGPRDNLLARLLVADRARTALALVAALLALAGSHG